MTRLKRHRSGARLNLREDDLLIAVILPPSINVHIVKVIVSQCGAIEFAEWITGSDGSYSHHEKQLNSQIVAQLTKCLTRLGEAEQDIAFDDVDCDYGEYEHTERTFLRFWFDGKERGAFLPNQHFYKDFDISEEKQVRFETAFRAVVSCLPTEWMSSES